MLTVKMLEYSELSDEEKETASENGSGSEWAYYIKVIHNGKTIIFESDAMEPEDATFTRDLSWISGALCKCYELGLQDAKQKGKKK
jgi:hypothetical protein